MSFSYSSFTLADIRVPHLYGQATVGGFCLTFALAFHKNVYPGGHISVEDLRLKVSVCRLSQGAPRFMGYAVPAPSCAFSLLDFAQVEHVRFDLLLSEGQLGSLEEFRGNDGLRFTLEITGAAHGPAGLQQLFETLSLESSLSAWTELLGQLGTVEYALLPVPLPKVDQSDPHGHVVDHLRAALKFMRQGEYTSVVAYCRLSLEALQAIGSLPTFSPYSITQQNKKEMSKGERLGLIQWSVNHLAHIAHHHTDEDEALLSRSDAMLALAACCSLLNSSVARKTRIN